MSKVIVQGELGPFGLLNLVQFLCGAGLTGVLRVYESDLAFTHLPRSRLPGLRLVAGPGDRSAPSCCAREGSRPYSWNAPSNCSRSPRSGANGSPSDGSSCIKDGHREGPGGMRLRSDHRDHLSDRWSCPAPTSASPGWTSSGRPVSTR